MPNGPSQPDTRTSEIPAVPLTIEGHCVLHQMMKIRWSAWRRLRSGQKTDIIHEAVACLGKMEKGDALQTAIYSLLGHKGDLMFIHFRESFDDLNRAELQLAQLKLHDYVEPTTSYLSVIELGLYESSVKTYSELTEKGLKPHSGDWNQAVRQTLDRQREAMRPRLLPTIPPNRYACFYPMNRLRGEDKNWYSLPIEERARQMSEHGLVGRRYAGEVKQIITGSIGFDDWEWGVDLFADDPFVFKKLIYEMRFDHVSAVYALFGQFFVGLRVPVASLGELMNGKLA